ncbi:MAG: aminotransferase class I/II-fold pyridoxal phosphate-dependent enzyme [Gammaproteobacteria bacterium]|nr:aminotransferase class I/II-fold pyridoxal phosphate-dependent enzyme [Gammaproteobacteria bacterium]
MSDIRNASRKSASASTRRAAADGATDLATVDSDGARGASHGSTPQDDDRPPLRGLSDYDYTNFYFGAGTDPFGILEPFGEWWKDAEFGAGYYLYGLPLGSAPATRVEIEDPKTRENLEGLINFASYNYLGLSYRPEVIEAICDAVRKYGAGASGSPVLSGTTDLHKRLANEVASFKGKEAALIFPTGYSANVGLIAGLMRPGDLVVADKLAHASVVDGMILSKATSRFFKHNNAADLDRKLNGFSGKKLVVVEGVYSMDGDVADLPAIVDVCRKHGARLLIDEAHSTFVYGPNGRGVAEHFGLDDEVDIHLGTFSKSLGGLGGFVAGPAELIYYLRGFARSRVFSCALPPPVTAGLLKALEIARSEPELRERLWDNARYMHALMREAGVDVGDSTSQVISIMIRDDAGIFQIAEDLLHAGVYINPVRFPAVGKHKSRFRMSISASHTRAELKEGAEIIVSILKKYGKCP